jgi:hypothetical protein
MREATIAFPYKEEPVIDLEKLILEKTRYVSRFNEMVKEQDKYAISASMCADEPLEIYLKIVFGQKEPTGVSDATLGTLVHVGLEEILKQAPEDVTYWATERAMAIELDDDWVLTGTADLIWKEPDGGWHILDWKTTKQYAFKKIKEEQHLHRYALQLAALKTLLKDTTGTEEDIHCHLGLFLKDANAFKGEKAFEIYSPMTKTVDAIKNYILDKVKLVQEHIESGTVPPECSDLWFRKINGQSVPSRCKLYCGVSQFCPYYQARLQAPGSVAANAAVDLSNW